MAKNRIRLMMRISKIKIVACKNPIDYQKIAEYEYSLIAPKLAKYNYSINVNFL
jgi:hypothetical protein